MLVIVGFCSQKGGVGKSTLARALAAVAAEAGVDVRVLDLDQQQQTVSKWQLRRDENEVEPALDVVVPGKNKDIAQVLRDNCDHEGLLIIDAPARSSKGTLELAREADLIVQPSGAGADDLDPAILLFHELTRAGVPKERLIVALCRVGTVAEETEARKYVQRAGYAVLPGSIPEKTAYREAHNRGQAVTETKHRSLNDRADALMERLIAMVSERAKAKVAAARRKVRA